MQHLLKEGKRRCHICNKIMAISAFEKNSSKAQGHGYRCKPCFLSSTKEKRYRFFAKGVVGKNSKNQKTSFVLRFEVLKRDGFSCQYCGARAPEAKIQVDHIVPLSRGGKATMDNLVAACWECNIGKGDKML